MFVLSISLLLLSSIHYGDFARTAIAVLYNNNMNTTSGNLTIYQVNGASTVTVTGTIFGLNNDTVHGFHVHTYAVSESSPNCTAAGGHFNPYNVSHGPPTANITGRHVGDLGNITSDAYGTVYVNITDSIIQLYNTTQSIINRTFVVHAMFDDGGHTGMNESAVTGNAGARLLCGLIKLVSDTDTTTISTMTTSTISMTIPTIKSSSWILLVIMIISCLFYH